MSKTPTVLALLLVSPAGGYVLTAPPHACARTAASLHAAVRCAPAPSMNLGERFMRLVKSNVNSAINSLEDPEKVLEQAVQDMQRDLVKVRQAYAEVSASSKRMAEQARLADAEAAKWYERAQLALEKGEDQLAREALTRRKQQLEMSDSLTQQVETQTDSITALYESMKELEAKMAEAKAKKDQIIARARTAKASTKVNDMLSSVSSTSSTGAFDRMSEKVQQLEAEADVSKQLAASSSTGAGSSLDQQFKALESGNDVDDELNRMRAALPASSVDDEMSEMKRILAAEEGDDK